MHQRNQPCSHFWLKLMRYWCNMDFNPHELPDDTALGDAIYAALLALIEQKSPIGRTLTVNDDKVKERVDGEILQ